MTIYPQIRIPNHFRWAKIGTITHLSFIGKEAIILGAGCHLGFLNLTTGEEHTYTVNNKDSGDGISCLTGHRTQSVFTFIENGPNPSIFIKLYPSFEPVHALKDDNVRGYINVYFSETSLMITLGDLPTFDITVWNWRRGEKLARQNSELFCEEQILRCNLSSPVFLAQAGANRLQIWDIFICSKRCVLTQHVVKVTCSRLITALLWNTEGTLFVLDDFGRVFTVSLGNLEGAANSLAC